MANPEHLAKLLEGPEAWSRWKGQYFLDVLERGGVAAYVKEGSLKPDLSGADLSGADLSGADLRRANLMNANLMQANLTKAFLRGAPTSIMRISAGRTSPKQTSLMRISAK
jgi:hypothetical protein